MLHVNFFNMETCKVLIGQTPVGNDPWCLKETVLGMQNIYFYVYNN